MRKLTSLYTAQSRVLRLFRIAGCPQARLTVFHEGQMTTDSLDNYHPKPQNPNLKGEYYARYIVLC